jgi:hypothetical protein
MTRADKAREWEWAADMLDEAQSKKPGIGLHEIEQLRHIWIVIVPSLRRRAAIIRRNGKRRK